MKDDYMWPHPSNQRFVTHLLLDIWFKPHRKSLTCQYECKTVKKYIRRFPHQYQINSNTPVIFKYSFNITQTVKNSCQFCTVLHHSGQINSISVRDPAFTKAYWFLSAVHIYMYIYYLNVCFGMFFVKKALRQRHWSTGHTSKLCPCLFGRSWRWLRQKMKCTNHYFFSLTLWKLMIHGMVERQGPL